MHKRKIRRHFSGTANLLLTAMTAPASGETFYDSMRRTMTQSIGKQLPTLPQKYSGPILVDSMTFTS